MFDRNPQFLATRKPPWYRPLVARKRGDNRTRRQRRRCRLPGRIHRGTEASESRPSPLEPVPAAEHGYRPSVAGHDYRSFLKSGARRSRKAVIASMFSGVPTRAAIASASTRNASSTPPRRTSISVRLMPWSDPTAN